MQVSRWAVSLSPVSQRVNIPFTCRSVRRRSNTRTTRHGIKVASRDAILSEEKRKTDLHRRANFLPNAWLHLGIPLNDGFYAMSEYKHMRLVTLEEHFTISELVNEINLGGG